MFRKKKARSKVRTSGMNDTLISYGTVLEGSIHCPANLRIDGVFKGDIVTQGVIVIGESGEAHSNMSAAQIIIAGKVIGELKSQGRLTITATGTVCGNCECEYLIVQEGGILNGSSIIERADSPKSVRELPADKQQTASKSEAKKGRKDEKSNEKQAG